MDKLPAFINFGGMYFLIIVKEEEDWILSYCEYEHNAKENYVLYNLPPLCSFIGTLEDISRKALLFINNLSRQPKESSKTNRT
jgi:hypothetical protein